MSPEFWALVSANVILFFGLASVVEQLKSIKYTLNVLNSRVGEIEQQVVPPQY